MANLNVGEYVKRWRKKLGNNLREYRRVLKVSEYPDREEFEMSAKVTGLGILILGLIGFIFYLLSNLLPQYV